MSAATHQLVTAQNHIHLVVDTGDIVDTIRACDLPLVLASIKLRKYTGGRTCQLCALSDAPLISVDCRDSQRTRERAKAEALRFGRSRARVMPMQRGHIGRLIERVQRTHGRRETLHTWAAGIRALLREPRYVLNGGSDA
jgi:hypothetical protein